MLYRCPLQQPSSFFAISVGKDQDQPLQVQNWWQLALLEHPQHSCKFVFHAMHCASVACAVSIFPVLACLPIAVREGAGNVVEVSDQSEFERAALCRLCHIATAASVCKRHGQPNSYAWNISVMKAFVKRTMARWLHFSPDLYGHVGPIMNFS